MQHDAVVIGSGPNGLVAANLLADEGWRVLVLEAQPTPGGAVRSDEGVRAGFIHDTFSSFYPLAAASPTIQAPFGVVATRAFTAVTACASDWTPGMPTSTLPATRAFIASNSASP